MKAIVCVKQVPDTSGKVAVNPPNIIKQAFEKCRIARYGILDEIMLKAIPQPREDVFPDWLR